MKRNSLGLLLLIPVLLTTSVIVQSQQPSFTVLSIKPFDKAVPGQVLDVVIDGINSGATPVVIPATDFKIEVSQDGITQTAKVRIVKSTMIPEANPKRPSRSAITFSGRQFWAYQAVSFVVPQGLHPGPAEVTASYQGQRGNTISMKIVEKPLKPLVGMTSVLAVGSMPSDRTPTRIEGNDFGWRLERGATARISVRPMVDPDDPNSAVLIRFKQGGNEYEAVTRIKSTPAQIEERGRGVGFFAPHEELEVDVPAALMLGKADVEIRVKANGQVSDAVTMVATISDIEKHRR